MQSFLIIDALQEFTNTAVGLVEIAVFVAVDLLSFQVFMNDSQVASS